MRALVVHCHPRADSYTAAVRDVVMDQLATRGVETRLIDLYREPFDPVLSVADLDDYEDTTLNTRRVGDDVEAVRWCDTLIFVYPTWWYGLPAILKGWLDRVMVPGLAFEMPEGGDIKPGLTHIHRLGVFTTCGASVWLTTYVGFPGRRTIMQGLGLLCARRCRKVYAAHYLMDSATPDSLSAHLDRVRRKTDHLLAPRAWWQLW